MWKSLARMTAVIAVAGAALWLAMIGSFKQEVRQSIAGGGPMPEFTLPVLNAGLFEGDTTFVRSADLGGKVVLLSFWATWCSPCVAEQPSLLSLQREFGDDGLVVLGVLHQDRAPSALAWLEEHEREDFRTVVGTREVARAAHVGGLPITLLVRRDGVVSEIFAGYWPERDKYLHDAVRKLLDREVKG